MPRKARYEINSLYSGLRPCSMMSEQSSSAPYTKTSWLQALRKLRGLCLPLLPAAPVIVASFVIPYACHAQGVPGLGHCIYYYQSHHSWTLADEHYYVVRDWTHVITALAMVAGGLILAKWRMDDAQEIALHKQRTGGCSRQIRQMLSARLWQSVVLGLIPVLGVTAVGTLWLRDYREIKMHDTNRRSRMAIVTKMLLVLAMLLMPVMTYTVGMIYAGYMGGPEANF